jgi:hypothetical protein
LRHRSLFCFEPDSPHRADMRALAQQNEHFKGLIVVLILVGVAFMMAKDPTKQLDPGSAFGISRTAFDVVSIFFFAVEFYAKVVAQGFALHPGSFLRDPWNILDFIVLVFGLANFLPFAPDLSAAKILRVFRLVKVIRAHPGLRALIDAIAAAGPGLVNVGILTMFAMSIFGMIGKR